MAHISHRKLGCNYNTRFSTDTTLQAREVYFIGWNSETLDFQFYAIYSTYSHYLPVFPITVQFLFTNVSY